MSLKSRAVIKEIKSQCGLFVWVCILDGKEFCRSWSEQGLRLMILHHIRKNTHVKNVYIPGDTDIGNPVPFVG